MAGFRRLVFVVLLLTVPFQAALGATGMLCGPDAHHAQDAPAAPHSHDGEADADHHHPAVAPDLQHDGDGGPLTDGKCKVCGESCCSALAIPASALDVFAPDTVFRVSASVEPDIVSRTGDGLFRPPRV